MLNWYSVRLTMSSTEMSCTGCMYRLMPSTLAASLCRSRMTSVAALRPLNGFKLI
jgi:hypothetical protein